MSESSDQDTLFIYEIFRLLSFLSFEFPKKLKDKKNE